MRSEEKVRGFVFCGRFSSDAIEGVLKSFGLQIIHRELECGTGTLKIRAASKIAIDLNAITKTCLTINGVQTVGHTE